ncbi:zinc finger protein 2 [Colletotrichum karsti]|uniref:C2H2 type master regulator of conidiophore development brlA n=1 Tax=Colletotrichum karsti TaxID=1095194 RepID=A0A9P6I9M3_9PEZI|nr:zinc finger protein 2 [Colletotrichum karsti]KAF9879402.1 zinc finger protein 2 [Colletotrichum karsti]
MAPPAASSEGVSAQSDLGDTDDTSSLVRSIDMDQLGSSREMVSLSARSTLEPRREGLRPGGIAAVVIGVVLFFVLAIICAFPFVIRRIRRSKSRRNGANRLDTAETAFIPPPLRPSGPAPATGPGAPSRMSSKDTLGHKIGGRERQSTKEMTISSHNGIDASHSDDLGSHQRGYTGDEGTHPPSVTTRRGTDHSFGRSPTWKSETSYPWTPVGLELVATRADGMDYSEATHGHSAAYYSPIVPSEAFGMITPPPTDEPVSRAPPPRRSSSLASSLKQNLMSMMGGRSSTKDSMNTRSKAIYQPQPTSDVLREGLSDSPTELTGPSFPPPSTRQLGSPMHFKPPSPPSEPDHARDMETKKEKPASPPILPPTVPPPGTVNPMDIMAPSNPTEHNWHTNQQLYNIAHPPPKPPVEPEPSQAPTPQSPEQPFEHHQQYLQQQQQQQEQEQKQRQEQQKYLQQETQHQQWPQAELSNGAPNSNSNGHAQTNGWATKGEPAIGPDIHMNEAPRPVDPSHLMPNHANHHYYETEMTDPSEHSPQPGGHASSGASYQTTPNTQIDSSPSPRSDGSSDIRNSTSPYPGLQQSPRSFMCDECGRFFDQVHKLNHHKRYHERPHECMHPNCGKRFGTKTHLDRHINDKHKKTKKFHCTVSTCPYSKAGGKSFPRKDNWRRHMVNIHQVTPMGDPEPDMIDETMGGT